MIRQKKKIFIFIATVLMVVLLFWSGYSLYRSLHPELDYRYFSRGTSKVGSISLLGDNNQYVLVTLDKTNSVRSYSVSRNYLAEVVVKEREDDKASLYSIDPGEVYRVNLYDLNGSDFQQTTIDVGELLEKNDIKGGVGSIEVLMSNNQDYLCIATTTKEKYQEVMYNIATKKIDRIRSFAEVNQSHLESSKSNYMSVDYNIKELKTLEETYGLTLYTLSLNSNFYKVKNLDNLNISTEEPTIAKALESGSALFVRPTMVSKADWFNTVIHWFAPKGQDVMELYATDKSTGERTQIKSYADYEAWEQGDS